MLVGAAAAAAGVAAYIATRRLDAVAVRGLSMAPALLPGDRLLVARRRHSPRIGEVVIVADPGGGHVELIKRVTAVGPEGVTLLGDNRSRSTDARSFGPLPRRAVSWRVVLRYWPPSRLGAVPNSISTGSDPAAHALSEPPSAQP